MINLKFTNDEYDFLMYVIEGFLAILNAPAIGALVHPENREAIRRLQDKILDQRMHDSLQQRGGPAEENT